MKEGWEYKKLGDICTIVGRIGFRGYTKADLVRSSKDGAITLSPSNIIDGELNYSKCTYINWDKYYESPEIMLDNGDVVLVKTASIGKCAVVKNLPHEATLNPQFVVLKQLIGVPDFICYYLKSSIAQNTIKQMAGGVAIPTLSQKKLSMMIIPAPHLTEQQSIVDYLDSAFAKIDAIKANAEKALNEAKALFQASLKEMLEPKEGWEEKTLKEICTVINGRAYSKDEMLKQGKYRLLRVGNFFTNDSWYYSDLELDEDKYCDNGDLLYAWSASFGPRIWDGEKVIYHYHIWKMVCSAEINKYFLCYWLDSDELKKQTMINLHGATMAHITKGIIEAANVGFPSVSEQQKIVDTLDSIKAKVDRLQENCNKISQECDALKQAILKQVFS